MNYTKMNCDVFLLVGISYWNMILYYNPNPNSLTLTQPGRTARMQKRFRKTWQASEVVKMQAAQFGRSQVRNAEC